GGGGAGGGARWRPPRRGGRRGPWERGEPGGAPGGAGGARPRLHVLPAEEEAHEVRRANRLDGPPQATERQPVDAGEQRPIAPLLVPPPGPVAPAQRGARLLAAREADRDARDGQPGTLRQLGRRGGTQALEPAPRDGAQRVLLGLRRSAPAEERFLHGRCEPYFGERKADQRGTLRGDEQRVRPGRAACTHQLVGP